MNCNTTLYILELMPFEGGKLLGCFCRSHIQFCEKCLKSRSSFYSPSEKKETGAKKIKATAHFMTSYNNLVVVHYVPK